MQKKTKEEPQDGVKPPSQHYKCSVLVVVLQGPSVVGSCSVTAIMPPSVFWVAQLVERQTVIATRLLSEGPWFEPMSRSFCYFLVRPDGSIGMVDLGRSIYIDTTHDPFTIRRKNSIGVIISDFHHEDSTSSMYSEDACSSHASFTFCSARRG